ncbi:hypothetical protein PIB30_045250, partial [Stylosanthes scabra]|nr:hypothetical protein [Stylosanthes scabra]
NITPSKTGDNTNSSNKNDSSGGVYDKNSEVTCDKHKVTMNQDYFYAEEPTTTSDSVSEIVESENWISQPTLLDVEDYNMSAIKMRKVAKKS